MNINNMNNNCTFEVVDIWKTLNTIKTLCLQQISGRLFEDNVLALFHQYLLLKIADVWLAIQYSGVFIPSIKNDLKIAFFANLINI